MARRTTERSFDELARGLVEGSISRRRALKLFAGSAIAALIPSRALAGGHGHGGGHGKPEKCKDPFICHRPPGNPNNAQTLCIPKKAREAHLKNHPLDTCGPCGGTTSSTTTSTTSTTSTTTTPTTTTSTTTPGCLPERAPCTTDTDCCNNICNRPSGSTTGICLTCRSPGGSCAAGEPCCNLGSSCENGSTCCTPSSEPCTDDSECCSGLTCDPRLRECLR
jgi:hypothetical protein